ncbi:hypothetical protein ACH5RR_023922 [Cinchona calisaya]|uniref:Uncharacterized protein n=1 Tax=Cinchona calisaya TaxID=153742 RepID=A0ABD2ZFG4_9GENT
MEQMIMQMKIVRGVTPIVLLLYLIIREFFFFSSKFSSSLSQHDDQHEQISFVSQVFLSLKPSYLVVFFTFNIIVVALLVGKFTQISCFSSSSSSSSSAEVLILSSINDPYDHGLKSTKDDEDYNYEAVYNDEFMSKIGYFEYNNEEKIEGDYQSYDDYYYCYDQKEEIITTYDDQHIHGGDHYDDQEEQKAEFLISSDQYCKYDHHDEEMINDEEEDIIYSELNDDDFNKRIEEFIDENNKKWREELKNERLIYVDRIIS